MDKPLHIAIVGFGAAAQAFIPAIQANPSFHLAAVVEPHPEVQNTARLLGVPVFQEIADLKQLLNLDGVYLATPTPLHSEQAIACLEIGWHVLVEKPMACNLSEAQAMVDASRKNNRHLTVGHSHSFDAPVQAMRQIIQRGEIGTVTMVNNWCFTDWVYRPRRPEELDSELGGGVLLRQGAHQIDILRALCWSEVKTVKAKIFNTDPKRNTLGAHAIYLDFENGAAATAIYNGYGGMSSMDLTQNISEWGFEQPTQTRQWFTANQAPQSVAQELAAKQKRALHAIPATAPFQPHFGLTVVSGSLGDIRQTPQGLLVCNAAGSTEIQLPSDQSPRDLVLVELEQTWRGMSTQWHSGYWGLENLRICEAAMASATTGREVILFNENP